MNKLQLTLTSLVAVLPAGFLMLLLVNVMLSHSQNLSTMAFLVLGVTLLSAGGTFLIPAALWVGDRKKPKLATAKVSAKGSKADEDEIEAVDEDIEAVGSDAEVKEASSGSFEVQSVLGDSSEFNLEDSEEMVISDDLEADIDTDPVEDFEEFDLEEEPKPKKKKR